MPASEGSDLESWLQGIGDEEKPRQKEKLSETRTVRFSPAMADRLDQLADERGISVPALIRSMCSERQPSPEGTAETVDQLYDLIGQLADLSDDERAQSLRRQATKIYEQHRGSR